MLELKLSSDEQRLLVEVLDSAISELGTEIGHTDVHDYREGLKDRKQALLSLADRLKH